MAVVVSAGPPGAGKSAVLESMDLAGYRLIDPDVAKDMVIGHALDAGLLEYRRRFMLPDGDSVHPRELAPHVHQQSTRLADLVRQLSLASGENVIIDGTLAWEPLGDQYISELYKAGYEQLDVIAIELQPAVAIERATRRWWVGREEARGFIADSAGPLGGRFVPEEAVARCYSNGGRDSLCSINARRLAERADDELGRGSFQRYVVSGPDATPRPVQ
ncbi:zeta toxin family protein [Sinomonas sp. P10A9]|uniref:UDP-N-acetylglucosamine kinase n=1 Tax=Sinomonas puerhi TaxID=3238584 RepID=A0AB39L5I9_9MICC